MQEAIERITSSAEETQALARALGQACSGGEVFLLVGPLGAGKTCFAQGLAAGLDVRDYVHSPTFVLMGEYRGRLPLYHLDLYRLDSAEEMLDMGVEERFYGDGVSVVEWADKALDALPEERLLVHIEPDPSAALGAGPSGPSRRRITFEASGRKHEVLLEAIGGRRAAERR